MRRLSLLVSGAIGAVCGVYAIVYLVRWEWNRAIIAGIFFLAIEIIVASVMVIERLRRIEGRLDDVLARPRERPDLAAVQDLAPTLEAIRGAAPPPPDRFGWIRDQTGSMGVFLPVLLGAGVLVSALAWVVEHLARATVSPTLERRLAVRLDALALPPGGLRAQPLTDVLGRRPRWGRRVAAVGLAMGTLVAVGAGIGALGDMTQTRPDVMDPDAQTVVEVVVRGAVAEKDPARVVGHLWSVCTSPDVFRTRQLPTPVVEHGRNGVTRILVDTDIGSHSIDRLRGCLNDAKMEKVQATVLGVTVG